MRVYIKRDAEVKEDEKEDDFYGFEGSFCAMVAREP